MVVLEAQGGAVLGGLAPQLGFWSIENIKRTLPALAATPETWAIKRACSYIMHLTYDFDVV